MSPTVEDVDCSTCLVVGRRGYCAPARCYCGHDTCYAFASFVALPPTSSLTLELSALVPPTRRPRICPSGRPITSDGDCCGKVHATPAAER